MRGEADRRLKSVARVARPLALTLAGGAGLTLLTAGMAGAQQAGTGDATATGNQSGTNAGQTLTMKDGGIATLDAGVGNAGAAGSNSGVNQAVGLGVDDGDSDDATNIDGKNNFDEVGTDSSGETSVTTGWATSGGNVSTTDLDQTGSIQGGSSLVILQQGAFVLNAGLGLANAGFNEAGVVASGNAWALGNWSENDIDQVADATSGVSLLLIDQLSVTTSLGAGIANTGFNSGDITTGNASGTGSRSTNDHAQDTVADGDTLSAAVVEQVNRNRNRGLGVANSGFNFGSVDESTDADDLIQTPEVPIINGVPVDELIPF